MELKVPPAVLFLIAAMLIVLVGWATAGIRIAIPGIRLIALIITAAAGVIAITSIITFRRAKTTINPHTPDRSSTLLISGIYQYSRNPIYLSLALLLIACALYISSIVALIIVPAFVLYMNRYQILPEERALESRFGAQYAAYKRAVRRWI